MSIKKLGQGGEYLYFPVKKKFYSLVFFDIKIVFDFAGIYIQNFIKSKSNLSYILRPRLRCTNYNITFFICIIITLLKKNFLLLSWFFVCNADTLSLYFTHQSV